jgi:hypothetical protein
MFENRCGFKNNIYVPNIFFGAAFVANALNHDYFPGAYSLNDLKLNVDSINTNIGTINSNLSSLQIYLNSPPASFNIYIYDSDMYGNIYLSGNDRSGSFAYWILSDISQKKRLINVNDGDTVNIFLSETIIAFTNLPGMVDIAVLITFNGVTTWEAYAGDQRRSTISYTLKSTDSLQIKTGWWGPSINDPVLPGMLDPVNFSIKETINTVYYTKSQIDGKGFLTTIPLEYITETELNAKGYLTSIPSEFITETELNGKGYLTTIPSEFITETELAANNYSKTQIDTNHYTKTQIDTNIYTKTQIDAKGYLTTIPAEYITESELAANNYTKTQIDTNIYTKTQIDAKGYLTTIPSEYITETELNSKGYLTTATNTYQLPTASTSVLGGVRVDNSTITINGSGVISATAGTAQVNSDWTQTNTSLKSFIQNKPTAGTNISFQGNTITNTIIGSPTQNIIDLNTNHLIIKDKPNSVKEDFVDIPLTSINEPTVNPYVIATDVYFPRIPATNSATWTDSGKTIVVKISDAELYTDGSVYFLFNHIITSRDHYHSQPSYTGTGNTYAGATRFKTFAGIAIGVDFGRSIYPERMRIAPRPLQAGFTGDAFIIGAPKAFKIFASDDASCWNDNNHSSWTQIHDQTTGLTYTNEQYTIVNFTTNLPKYRYYTMVVLSTIGNYAGGHMIFSEWNIGGDEKIDAIPEGNPITHKTLNFVYDNKLLRYDFTNQNTEATWKAYASTIPNFTYSLDSFLTTFDSDAVWTANSVVGWIQMTLPSTHNFLTITYGLGVRGTGDVRLLINGVLKSTATPSNISITYSQSYNVGDVVRIEETLSTMSANFIFQFTNTNPNQYTLSVQQGTSIQVNNQPAQYLSGNYTISVGATQSSVLISGFSPIGQTDPYPLQNGSTIVIRYSMIQRITSFVNYKKDGLIKYVPASGTNPTTGTWQIVDIDTQPLTQFAGNLPISRTDGNLPISRTDGNLPASRIDNLDMSNITTGSLDWSRISFKPSLSGLSGQLDQSRIDNLYIAINDRFARQVPSYANDNFTSAGNGWRNKFRIATNLHLNTYNNTAGTSYQYFLSLQPNNVANRHKYWFGMVRFAFKGGSDAVGQMNSSSLMSSNSTDWVFSHSSTDGVFWLEIEFWATSTTSEPVYSLNAILH